VALLTIEQSMVGGACNTDYRMCGIAYVVQAQCRRREDTPETRESIFVCAERYRDDMAGLWIEIRR
jgi:hypothetical protein